MTHEELPLAVVSRQVLLFLARRADAVLFGAHAVNAYCATERMTQDVDILSTRGGALAEELRAHLAATFRMATRVREVVPGGFRVYQLRQPANRHLVDIRHVDALPSSQEIAGISVVAPPDLIAMKVLSLVKREGRPKGGTDLVDLQRLLLAFPELQAPTGPVQERLRIMKADEATLARWAVLASMAIEPDEDEGY